MESKDGSTMREAPLPKNERGDGGEDRDTECLDMPQIEECGDMEEGMREGGKAQEGSVKYYGSDDEAMGPGHVAVEVTRADANRRKTRQLFTHNTIHTYDPNGETHYVLVIHGTFDAPPAGFQPVPWYWVDPEKPRNFTGTLAHEVADSGLGSWSLWRDLPSNIALPPKVPYPFYWNGHNSHEARNKAGRDLAQLIDAIGKADPSARVHLVAHSHGGNVVLRALSHYLTLLRRDVNTTYNDVITNAFWEEHAEHHKAIAQWQPVPTDHSVWATILGPFYVAKRPWEADPGRGSFPWGNWEITDRILGLPKVRQRKYLRKAWATSSNTNCLGRVVFMGTPFYSKCWVDHAWIQMLWHIIVMSFVFLCVIVAFTAVIRVVLNWGAVSLVQWKEEFWITAGVGSFVLVLYNTFRHKRYYDGNLYFTEKKAWSPAMQALVLNAGKLDEAALALSTEPLVRAYLLPQLQSFMNPNPWRSFRPFPSKEVFSSLSNGVANCAVCLWNVVVTLPYLLLRLLNFVLVPLFSEQLLRLFITLGFGLQKGELEFARVYVEEYLRLPEESHSVLHWNVAKILSGAMNAKLQELQEKGAFKDLPKDKEMNEWDTTPETDDLASSVAERWKFLWDDETLNKKAQESPTVALLQSHLDSMQPPPRTNRVAFEREIKLICLTLEERYKDMTGNVELSHGGYFRNTAVIAAIGNFLATGVLPEWTRELGDVLGQDSLGPDPRTTPSMSSRYLDQGMSRRWMD